jgi:hypothetical protein
LAGADLFVTNVPAWSDTCRAPHHHHHINVYNAPMQSCSSTLKLSRNVIQKAFSSLFSCSSYSFLFGFPWVSAFALPFRLDFLEQLTPQLHIVVAQLLCSPYPISTSPFLPSSFPPSLLSYNLFFYFFRGKLFVTEVGRDANLNERCSSRTAELLDKVNRIRFSQGLFTAFYPACLCRKI